MNTQVNVGHYSFEISDPVITQTTKFKIGDKVKLYIKDYNNSIYPGVIVGFDDFKDLPTISILYIQYGEIKLIGLNEVNKDTVQIIPSNEASMLDDNFQTVLFSLNQKIVEAQSRLTELKLKRDFYIKHYGKDLNKTDSADDLPVE